MLLVPGCMVFEAAGPTPANDESVDFGNFCKERAGEVVDAVEENAVEEDAQS